ncbi:hypothetical protein [Flavobacterium sp. 3HN19-14]|uniref:hypothetical protein n=1 Tax=Flavobacterium sp. 3HN19-14 TaxID=3448133 RepID=UPI003EE13C31
MNLHNFSNNALFNSDILIESQYVKAIQFITPPGTDFDFNSENINLDYQYHILDNSEDKRFHIVLLEFSITENGVDGKEPICVLNIVLEGIYKINDSVEYDDSSFSTIKHFGSLNLIINFLRLVLYNITSMTSNTGFYLPLIDISKLHEKNMTKPTKKRSKKVSSKK